MKVLTIIGARPQFIKAWSVSRALAQAGAVEFVTHTGQHYDERMSGRLFAELQLRTPDENLGVGSGSHAEQTGRMLIAIEQTVQREQPDWVLVYGDTNSTLAGALAAAKCAVRVAHVEAGLRSFNRAMPEETNRIVTDRVSARLFCPSAVAVENLRREGMTEGVHRVGDVMFDALRHFSAGAERRVTILEDLQLARDNYYLATVHRAATTDRPEKLHALLSELARLDRRVVLPLHPRSRASLQQSGFAPPSGALQIVEPASYLEMLALTRHARAVLTDSGGLQKEAYWLGVPCVTLREETEWIETLEDDWNQLAGLDPVRIRSALQRRPRGERQPHYGSGDAALRIVAELMR